jgi:hypothetical protein
VVCGEGRFADWPDDGQEPGLLVGWFTVEFDEQGAASQLVSLAFVSLHALARRYQRGRDTTEAAIFADLAALESGFRRVITSSRFTVPVPGGAWVGEVANADGSAHLAVRTYYDVDSGAPAVTPL